MNQRIAIPTSRGLLSMHFGHCDEFTLIDVDMDKKEIIATKVVISPQHEPGLLPRWLHEQGVNLIISGGMGSRAQALFPHSGIETVVGAPCETPERIVKLYLNGSLQVGVNLCDH